MQAANGRQFTYAVVSRRSRHRVGTRYNVRGIDERGNVANYVETEQIVVASDNSSLTSFLVTRGSIPLYWSQLADIKYKPKPRLTAGATHDISARRHFEEQVRTTRVVGGALYTVFAFVERVKFFFACANFIDAIVSGFSIWSPDGDQFD